MELDYNLNVAEIVSGIDSERTRDITGQRAIALETIQFFVLCLGDLGRYRYQKDTNIEIPYYLLPPYK